MSRPSLFGCSLAAAVALAGPSCVESEDNATDVDGHDASDTTDTGDTVFNDAEPGDDTLVDATDAAADGDETGDGSGGDDVEPDGSGHAATHWSYEGETGPAFWGELDEQWALCGDGVEQSPIDFGKVAPHASLEIDAEYGPVLLFVENNGHTIEVAYEGGGALTNALGTFEARQFHFHTPSEHQVRGQSYPLEMHIVHQNELGERAVLGVFFEEGEANEAFGTIVANAPSTPDEVTEVVDTTIDVASLLPDTAAGWTYAGSLTTPPCDEAVSWQVLWQPVTASIEQIDAMRTLIEPNARPVQPLGERHIDGAHFEYEGSDGPLYWGELSPEWTTCSEGEAQSPIDIASAWIGDNTYDILLDYDDSPITVSNNGHTVQFDYAPGSTMTVGAQTWELVQFHFHAGAEHTFDGSRRPLELHFVHQDDEGSLAVLGVTVTHSDFSAMQLSQLTDHLAGAGHEPHTIEDATINALSLIPSVSPYVAYDGSLTTPPCTEGVRWFVIPTPLFGSADEIEAFTDVFSNTARPTQPLNGRTIE